jgi:hypothetical protein
VKAEGIGGEREGDFTDNFNVWKMSQNCCGELNFVQNMASFYIKLKKTTVLAFIYTSSNTNEKTDGKVADLLLTVPKKKHPHDNPLECLPPPQPPPFRKCQRLAVLAVAWLLQENCTSC